MSDLVAKVAEQSAIRLVHIRAQLLSLCVIGFLERYCDDAVVMTGLHLPLRHVGKKIEDQRFGITGSWQW